MNRPQRTTLMAFGLLVLLGGSNAVAVRFSNVELPPFWGAAIRFSAAAIVFWVIILAWHIALPNGRALAGVLIFGVMAIGINYALLYWALVRVQAGFTMVVGAFVPLLTFLFALGHGLEAFRWRGLLGALIAIVGILLAAGSGLGTDVPLTSLLALIVAVAFLAEGPIILKLFPPSHPIATNAIAVTIGAVMLLALSFVVGEERSLPTSSDTWISFAYLVVLGTVVLFYLYLFVLSRWTASATNYAFLLFPIVTVAMAAWLLEEEVSAAVIIGGAIVVLGVWVGAFGGSTPENASEGTPSAEEITS
ncbi:MAG: DMT family transporter [Anaerolineales bacterium]